MDGGGCIIQAQVVLARDRLVLVSRAVVVLARRARRAEFGCCTVTAWSRAGIIRGAVGMGRVRGSKPKGLGLLKWAKEARRERDFAVWHPPNRP